MNRSLQMKSVLRLLLLGCVMTSLHAVANPITRQQAQQNALAFMKERGKSVSMASLRHAPMRAAQPDEPQPYYVFNIGDNQGYVIASGDDCAYAVLGYSDEGAIDLNNLPCNLQAWLDGYAQQIQYKQEHGLNIPCTPKRSEDRPPITPMLTCNWGQSDPYNMYCPVDSTTDKRCLAGCVPVAIAQMMYYHRDRSVNQLLEDIPGYDLSNGIHVDTIQAGSLIDWDNMIDSYKEQYHPTESQKQAVANLMKYCGTAIHVAYDPDCSAGTLSWAPLSRYFNYSRKTTIERRDSYSSDEDWESLIYNELSNSRPVCYSGDAENGTGHAFVCDGYDGNGHYHINWGWYGSSNGFFMLTALPTFSYYHSALINAMPRTSIPDPNIGIHFADPETRYQCLMNWDENDDGALTLEEAAAVSDIGRIFRSSRIKSFDEFKYFTNVATVPERAFSTCGKLSCITIPNSVTTIGSSAFYRCTSLTNVTISNSVTSIGSSAFYGCTGLTSIDIPNSVTAIDREAFLYCDSLKNLTIGSSVATIGSFAFYGCNNLTDLTWNAKNYTSSFNIPTSVERVSIGNEVEAIPSLFAYDCTKLGSITFPSSVTSIGRIAFCGCSGLTSVTIPNTVKTIGSKAFYNSGLESVTINCDSLADGIFGGCTALKNVDFGTSLKCISDNAFYGCADLSSVTLPNSITAIGFQAFSNCSSLASITIPNSVTSIDNFAFNGCDNLTDLTWNAKNCPSFRCLASVKRLTFGSDVGNIPASFAYGCTNLTNVTIPSSVISIEKDAFKNTGLTSVRIPNSVTIIGPSAFSECSNLISIIISNSVSRISNSVFAGCSNLENVSIPNSVTVIEKNAFNYCTKLSSITIPSTVTKIGSQAFMGCTGLKYVTSLSIVPPEMEKYGFGSSYNTATLRVPIEALEVYKSTYPWNRFSNIVGLDPSLGDDNLDGEVNIADINTTINCILGSGNPLDEYMGDVNRDGEVNIADVNALIDIILSH